MAYVYKTDLKPVPPPPPYTLTMTLNQEEAEALFMVLHHVGGNPKKTARGLIDAIRNGMKDAGVVSSEDAVKSWGASLYFEEK